MSQDYEIGDLVWAKMKGYPPWPAKITAPKLDAKPPKNKKAHFVFFFGTKNFAWILDENISPHSDSILDSLKKNKSGTYQSAIDAFLECLEKSNDEQPTPEKEEPLAEIKKSPQTKVVKIVNSVKKKERKVMLSESEKKKIKKRSRSLDQDVNGSGAEYKPFKKRKVDNNNKRNNLLNSYSDHTSIPVRNTALSRIDKYQMDLPNALMKRKHVSPTKKNIGFIGLGHMGEAIVKNLLLSEHRVTVYSRNPYKCVPFEKMGAKVAKTAAELVINCDITIVCVSDAEASKSLIFQEKGILKGLEEAEKMGLRDKGYVEMTSLDPQTSFEIGEAVQRKNAKYLEAPVCGTSQHAIEGTLLILAAGDNDLFFECQTCFHAIGKKAYYINCQVGAGAKMAVVLSAFAGTICGSLAEVMVLTKRLNLSQTDVLSNICNGPLKMDYIIQKAEKMINRNFNTITPLKHAQKDLETCVRLSDIVGQHLPVYTAVNEVLKRARLRMYSDFDVSAVFHGLL